MLDIRIFSPQHIIIICYKSQYYNTPSLYFRKFFSCELTIHEASGKGLATYKYKDITRQMYEIIRSLTTQTLILSYIP